MLIIERIRNLREDNDLTQKEMARILHVSQRAYSHYENGSRKIPLEVIVEIAEHYNCSVDFILCRTDNRKINK